METKNITWALVGGLVLAALGIGLFLLIFAVLAEAAPATRLFTAMCVPPLVMALVVGIFVLVRRDRA